MNNKQKASNGKDLKGESEGFAIPPARYVSRNGLAIGASKWTVPKAMLRSI